MTRNLYILHAISYLYIQIITFIHTNIFFYKPYIRSWNLGKKGAMLIYFGFLTYEYKKTMMLFFQESSNKT